MQIDLNCDLGEGFPNDRTIMPLISSANIACGFHAGDTDTMRRTIAQAVRYQVAIGAHPGFQDKENFGRSKVQLSAQAYYDLVYTQIDTLNTLAKAAGTELRHVKPHGALYNMAASDPKLASIVAQAVLDFNPTLILYGLSGSNLISQAQHLGLSTASEVFADRTYQANGTLTPRSQANALIQEPEKCLQQVLEMIQSGTVTATKGDKIPIRAETICLHGDGAHAVAFARSIRRFLMERGIRITAP